MSHADLSQPNSAPMIIVDGSSYLFRAFHALPPLTSQGLPTGAIKGVMSMLQKLVDEYSPTYMCVVFDTKGPNFRHHLYPDYKANRGAPPEDLVAQIEPIHQLVKAMGLPLLALPGIEADDIIATVAVLAEQHNMKVIVSSGDKDLAQLVNDNIHLVNTMKQDYLDPAGVLDKFGVQPSQIVDYLALIGDTSDNIPGIDKVGPKTAVKWLQEYSSLDVILDNADAIKGKIGENLRSQRDRLTIGVQLVTLLRDVELPVSIKELHVQKPQLAELKALLSTFEFKNDLKKLEKLESNSATILGLKPAENDTAGFAITTKATYKTLIDEASVTTWLHKAQQAPWIAFDTETTSLEVHSAELVGVSLAYSKDEAVYIPCAHVSLDGTDIQQVSQDFLISALRPILEAQTPLKVGQNLKYDLNVLKKYNLTMVGIGGDTMLESYAINPSAGRHDMDSLAQRFINRSTISFTDIAGKGVKQKTFDQIPLEIAAEYAAEDGEITWLLHEELQQQLNDLPQQKSIYETLELPLLSILAHMEYKGTLIDDQELAKQSTSLDKTLVELEKKAFDLVGEPFNMASPKQIGVILYEKMNIPVIKKTPKGAPSTAESVLQTLAQDFELPKILLEHRSLAKLKSTYTDKLPELIHPKTGRIHTSYHQAVTATGRLSSSDPNLQNIPIKTAEGRRIRKAFIAPANHKLVAADYSQIELRIMAHLSEDKRLCQAFDNNEDVHCATASEVFEVNLDQVTQEHRRSAKAINFGLIYGMSAYGLGQQLSISRQDAQSYIDRYFARYPGVLQYMETTKERARTQGYVTTIMGRRLYLPDIHSKNHGIRQGAERTAINAPMQGTAADIVKIAMIYMQNWLVNQNLESTMIMQVHDEIVLESPNAELDIIMKQTPMIMASAAQLKVPLIVTICQGANWLEAH